MLKKAMVIFFMSYSTLLVVMYSTSYTSGIPGMMNPMVLMCAHCSRMSGGLSYTAREREYTIGTQSLLKHGKGRHKNGMQSSRFSAE
jgi:hypothetical protein